MFGGLCLVAPGYAFSRLGLLELSDSGLFQGAFLGAVMAPWGVGLVLQGRPQAQGRAWVALALANSTVAIVVLIFFLGKGTVSGGGVWPLLIVYGAGLIGTAACGHRELRGASDVHLIEPDRESASAQEGYRVNLQTESDRGDSPY